MPGPGGATLRAWRLSQHWAVPELARQIRRAAGGTHIAGPDALKAMIHKWERDAVEISERYMLLYCKVFDASPAQIARGPAQPHPAPVAGEPLSRLDFLRISASVVSLLDVMHGNPLPDLGDRVSAAVSGRIRVDGEMAEGLAHIVLGYRTIYRSARAASLLAPVGGTLDLLTELAPAAGAHRDLVVSLIGQAASLAGVILTLDQGDFGAGGRYLAIAAQAAKQSGDDELLAVAFGCRAFHSAYGGDLPEGVAYATHALDVAATNAHPLTCGWVAAVASEMHAMGGDERSCLDALETAEARLSLPAPARPWKGIGAFSRAKLSAYRGGDLMRLGRYRDARVHLHDALARLEPVYAKHRCTAYIDLACSYVEGGRPGEGAARALEALEIAAVTRHADSIRRIVGLEEAVRPSGTQAARDLRARLMEVKAAA